MTKKYRFHLFNDGGRLKTRCPECGEKTFTPYVDDEGEVTFPPTVGICDRINSCGYHCPPREYFQQNSECKPKVSVRPREPKEEAPTLPTLYLPDFLLEDTMQQYERNTLFQFLSTVMGETKCLELFRLYNVGTSKAMGGSTVFWQVDIQGRIRTGKVMRYAPNGHRAKDGMPSMNWVHRLTKEEPKGVKFEQCFFGEHLLNKYPEKTVIIVESEKSALVAAYALPDFLWLASGGCDGCLNAKASQALAGRKVKLMPDLDMMDKWRKKAEMLREICESVEVMTTLEDNATEEQRQRGCDIADFILEMNDDESECSSSGPPTDSQVLDIMVENNPLLGEFVDTLQLSCKTPNAINYPIVAPQTVK